jgi:hypothetical protein
VFLLLVIDETGGERSTAELKALKQDLYNRNATLEFQLQDTQAASRTRTLAKLPLPEKYDGKRNQFRQFINSVKLHFNFSPERFPSDTSKTGFDTPRHPIVLGAPWLERHNPDIDWRQGQVKLRDLRHHGATDDTPVPIDVTDADEFLHDSCGGQLLSIGIAQAERQEGPELPSQCCDFSDVFDKAIQDTLPSHRQYDCTIDLEPGKQPPYGPIYPLS